MDAIMGTWKLKKGSESNMEAFMQASMVPVGVRQVFYERDYEVTFSKVPGGNKLKLLVVVTNDPRLEPKEYEFELGKQFDIDDVDGQSYKCTFNWDGEKMVEEYIDEDTGMVLDIQRKINPDGTMLFTMTFQGTTATAIWVNC